MSQFSLLDERWIPVRFLGGNRGELGIRDVLLGAKDIAVIEDPSPLVVAGLHRLLLAVLYRALEGPTDINQAQHLFRDGLPGDRIEAYLEKWKDRFWLFDERYPFAQHPGIPSDETEPWTKLTAEHNATSNKVLFDHTTTEAAGLATPAQCARWLVSTMSFAISGGRGYYPSPSANAMMCITLGRNLGVTLVYNLVPYSNREIARSDRGIWERGPLPLPLVQPKRAASGPADLYTWQPRLVLLEAEAAGGVGRVRFIAGEGFEASPTLVDPMLAYRVDKEHGKLPLQFREGRGAWRDFASLLPGEGAPAPAIVEHADRLARKQAAGLPTAILVLGLRYDPPNANVSLWRMERFALPQALAGDRNIRNEIDGLLGRAEDCHKALWAACSSFARHLLGRGDRAPAKADIAAFVRQGSVSPFYWATLEPHFHEVLSAATLNAGSGEIEREWLTHIRNALREAWERHRAMYSAGDAWTIRALTKAEGPVARQVKELTRQIDALTSQSEVT